MMEFCPVHCVELDVPMVLKSTCDAGHEGQALAAREDTEQGLLSILWSLGQSGQARSAGRISWLELIDDSRLVCRSVENWTATSVRASL